MKRQKLFFIFLLITSIILIYPPSVKHPSQILSKESLHIALDKKLSEIHTTVDNNKQLFPIALDNKLSEIHTNMNNKLAILRLQVLKTIEENRLGSSIYSNLTKHKIYPIKDIDKYLKEIKSIKPIKTISYTCTVYTNVAEKFPDIPYCGPPFQYYRYGVASSQCSSKHWLMSTVHFCFDRHNLSVTQNVEHDITLPEDTNTTLFVHVIPFGRVDMYGNVQVGNVTISPKACSDNNNFVDNNDMKKVKEVFVISQYWGNGFFHAMIEDIPRISMYLTFLRKFDNILVHVGGGNSFIRNALNALGINAKRVISGPVIADVIYFPQGGHCGNIRQPVGYLLSKLYHNYTKTNLLGHTHVNNYIQVNHNVTSNDNDNKLNIILIKRSGKRWVDPKQNNQIEQQLIHLSNTHGFRYYLFDDKNVPNFNETLVLFYNAVLIVGPHGAGLSNVIYSKPQTSVIELMCKENPNFCYSYLSEKQGHHHYVLASNGHGCRGMMFNITAVYEVINYFIQRIIENKKNL